MRFLWLISGFRVTAAIGFGASVVGGVGYKIYRWAKRPTSDDPDAGFNGKPGPPLVLYGVDSYYKEKINELTPHQQRLFRDIYEIEQTNPKEASQVRDIAVELTNYGGEVKPDWWERYLAGYRFAKESLPQIRDVRYRHEFARAVTRHGGLPADTSELPRYFSIARAEPYYMNDEDALKFYDDVKKGFFGKNGLDAKFGDMFKRVYGQQDGYHMNGQKADYRTAADWVMLHKNRPDLDHFLERHGEVYSYVLDTFTRKGHRNGWEREEEQNLFTPAEALAQADRLAADPAFLKLLTPHHLAVQAYRTVMGSRAPARDVMRFADTVASREDLLEFLYQFKEAAKRISNEAPPKLLAECAWRLANKACAEKVKAKEKAAR